MTNAKRDVDAVKRSNPLSATVERLTGQQILRHKIRAPWREDGTPSLHIYEDGRWHDFGTGEHGDVHLDGPGICAILSIAKYEVANLFAVSGNNIAKKNRVFRQASCRSIGFPAWQTPRSETVWRPHRWNDRKPVLFVRRSPMLFVCLQCGDQFKRKSSQTGKTKGHFKYCSRACYGLSRQRERVKVCAGCGTTFEMGKGRKGRQFCTLACANQNRKRRDDNGGKVQRICRQCGGHFWAKRGEVERGGGLFCSQKCWNLYNTGANNPQYQEHFTGYRGRGWRAIREEVLRRDGHCCVRCAKTNDQEVADVGRGLSIHHIEAYRNSQNNCLSNLESLCAACHMQAEWEARKVVVAYAS